ncbi:glycosyl transferase family 64 domain-containing protein [Gilbertella persicaria]|uniref:glycosyl transferase family 64 domain-containing protein n=1 Tax=Gilbertella persicaria TaxID=101096 RepID=UPI00221E72B4|nr:glycosyl transferase family 64 domain-containing protein [Gilbertella persicaria]KAI8064250.1 glycosyl transferase family 64 domain-containing protein [Gilbertella persicaria]
MFILEPNPQIFERLLRDYRKTSHVFNLLDQTYFRPMIEQDVKQMITMYSGHMKPWNFYGYSDVDWKKHYDPVSFYKWRRLNIDMKHALNPTEGSTWKNAKRQQNVCDAFLEATFSNSNSFPIQDQFSVLISTYNPERIEHLSLLIQHLLKSSKIHTVFITWHNPALKVPSSLFNHISEQDRVVILSQTFDSLNNRFNPIPELQTEAAYIMDDDIFIDLEDLEFTFHAWQSRKDSIVGHFPRRHDYHPDTLQASYEINRDPPYSIILTKSMFIRSDYLFAYTCLLEPKLHQVIDDQLNCEDLGFAMMASGITSVAPTYVKTKNPIHDFGLSKGISTNSAHMPARRKCISDFITQFWHKRDPLVYAYGAVAPFARPQTTKGNWKVVEKVVKSEKST